MKLRAVSIFVFFVFSFLFPLKVEPEARVLRFPTIHEDQIVFTFAGDLYTVSSDGGYARKLTSHPGYEAFSSEIAAAQSGCECPIIGSIGPIADVEQQQGIAVALQEAGVDAIELDFKWGAKHKDGPLHAITKAVKQVVSVPVIAKLSPFVGDIVENARAVEEAGADAITAINTVYPAMRIDCRLQRPTLSSGFGGLSGQPILPIAVAMIYQIYEAVDVPILGSGGVVTGEDALELIMAGAEAVQICTIAMLEGPSAFTRINGELEKLTQDLDLGSINECIGIAHRYKLHVARSATAHGKGVHTHASIGRSGDSR